MPTCRACAVDRLPLLAPPMDKIRGRAARAAPPSIFLAPASVNVVQTIDTALRFRFNLECDGRRDER